MSGRSRAWGQLCYAYLPKLFLPLIVFTINCLIHIWCLNKLLCFFSLLQQIFYRMLKEEIASNVWNWDLLSPRTLSLLLMTVIFFMFLLTWIERSWFACSVFQIIIISVQILEGESTYFVDLLKYYKFTIIKSIIQSL